MHSRFVPITAIAVISLLPIVHNTDVSAADWFDGQEILIECPVWEWEPSQAPGVQYELCFDDVDHCTPAQIGDSVCIPSLGSHDVWVTAIYYQDGEPLYYDGDIVPIARLKNADFSGNGSVGFEDFGRFTDFFGKEGGPGDLDGDGIVGFLDFSLFTSSFGKCVDQNETIYERC